MTRDYQGYQFKHICNIEPERDKESKIIEYMPQTKYINAKNLPLNNYGKGPFCQFRILNDLPFSGVYIISVDDKTEYIGKCQNLSERFNAKGYGTIHPRNCFKGGQSTNCKINNLILESKKINQCLNLWFLKTDDRKVIEEKLILHYQPKWNSQLKF